jgi:D-inositol-3-phosphate glycosyltransferase
MTQLAQENTEDGGPRSEIRAQRADISAGLSTINGLSRPSSATTDKRSTLDNQPSTTPRVSLLTGGGDKPYALGMAAALTSVGIHVDFIGSDDLSVPELLSNHSVNFLNLRGDQRHDAKPTVKILRVLRYYVRLVAYAATARPKLFHILWNNKFQLLDCTVLMLYYRLLGKRVVFTAHNVNAGKRDSNDSSLNRALLKIQYSLCDHIFVHTEGMKTEMASEFRIPGSKISVIPFGVNNTVPNTSLSSGEAKRQLGIDKDDKVLLFFGNIARYKGLEYLVAAFDQLLKTDRSYRLLIVGKPKGPESYWNEVRRVIANSGVTDRVIAKIEYVPDEDTELYFKAADVLILPYAHVFQSGVLFLGYSFGAPAIAADVGSLKEEIIEGKTGFLCKPRDPSDLARVIRDYFNSDLFHSLASRREDIKAYANSRYSWNKVAAITATVYSRLLTSNLRPLTSDF